MLKCAQKSSFPGLLPLFGHRKGEEMNNIKLVENTLGQKIKAQRIRMGLTQEQLAEKMFVPKTTISTYERDASDIKSSVLVDLANCLATTPDYLLGFEKKSDPISKSVIAVLSSIKDEKVKELLLNQIKLAAQMNF